ncbi:3-hydroxyacyl-CoA dehydrogenase NAD-binding domain-containing protein [Halosolutus amylolyticus]|uniref:3-hydroxyacyl-CoA dehydrogenase NAD-binding domain-containing protein n=1 Tax=Halosolutus amylolyticus TaxID=2932267 RepID=A0ABD5PIN9_9EURY|nr:3-hydroxyacyl-CoA dehydrogenase [Halosolutus amylolyticus]
MTVESIQNVTVIGAGTMGHGIAEITAMAGYSVTLQDVDSDALAEGYRRIEWSLDKLAENGVIESVDTVAGRIDTETETASAVKNADVVIEAVSEDLELKRTIFEDIDGHASTDAILASNTSSLSVSKIASEISRPERAVGLHFFNPPVKMDLVEVIYGAKTSDQTVDRALSFVNSLDKKPIEVQKDVFGFVVNNILHGFIDEPAWMVSRGEATIPEADAAMVHCRNYPMGPFELADLSGIDIAYDVRQAGDIPIPPVMQERVDAGEYGRKAGVGYYDYENGDGPMYEQGDGVTFDTLHVEACMANKAAELLEQDVTTVEDIDTGMQLGAGFPVGICERADEIGLGTIVQKLSTFHEKYGESRYEPAEYLVQLVEEGHAGVAAGAGFYEYDTE